jgi:hypothetical protein
MSLAIARKLLPPSAIIGISCTTPEHVRNAVEQGADYVGLGSVYATSTKDVSAGKMCGIAGARAMFTVLEGTGIKAVAIGTNHPLILQSSRPPIPTPTSRRQRKGHGMNADAHVVEQAALSQRICSAHCIVAHLPRAIPSTASQSYQISWRRVTPTRLHPVWYIRSALGRQQHPAGLPVSWSRPNKRLSTRAKAS